MQNINLGDTISLRHYSGINPYKSIVLGIGGNSLLVKLKKDYAVKNFSEGDPVVFGYEKDGETRIYGSNISSVISRQDTVKLEVDKLEPGYEKRQHERFPVSLYADIRTKDCRKKSSAAIKDISCYGMLIYTKTDLPANAYLDVDMYLDKMVMFLKTNILRKAQREHYFEYGAGIAYEDSKALNFMKDYIARLQREQKEVILKSR